MKPLPLGLPMRSPTSNPTVAKTIGGKTGDKIPAANMGRGAAASPIPSPENGSGENRSKFSTYFTKNQAAEVLYNGDRLWARVTLTLETAGPVCVGDSSAISPVLSGKGMLLETDVPFTFTIAKGTRLYIAATTINRVKVEIAPIPWLEQVVGVLSLIAGRR